MSVEIGEQINWEGEKPKMKEAKTVHSCGQCPFVYTELKQITKHVKTAPGHEPLCVPCNSRFSNFANLRHHLRRYHFNTGEFVCNECGKVSYSEQASYLHWNFVHKVDEGRDCTYKKYCVLFLKLYRLQTCFATSVESSARICLNSESTQKAAFTKILSKHKR